MTLAERIKAPGPKKILTLDGGGIRGMLTVEILAGIETLLRNALHKDDLVLADYFHFIAGTSTGAIIAACLSLGMTTADIRTFYQESGEAMFDKAFVLKRFRYKYEDEKLAAKLREVINGGPQTADLTLGAEKLKTLLMMVMRNATTDSPWPLSNNPGAKYNQLERRNPPKGDCNLDIPLWQLVRASTAAPVYFPPEVVRVGEHEFIFVDGGITTYNNPAFQAFLMATVKPYNLCWPTGEDQLLVVSVGTGTSPDANIDLDSSDMNLLYNAGSIPSALMFAALNEQDFLCRVFGKCLAGDKLDNEVKAMIGAEGEGPVNPKLFTYLRYNAELTQKGLQGLGLTDIDPKDVQKLDSVEHIDKLQLIGRKVVEKKIRPEHFAGFINK
jgi:predicted acylesterase/phospholipase RssA